LNHGLFEEKQHEKKEVDARGLACPQPVILAKKALEDIPEGEILVLVDTENARDNVVRLAESQGCKATARQEAGSFSVAIEKKAGAVKQASVFKASCSVSEGEIVYLFEADHIGSNRELGKVLVNGFLNAALSLPHKKCSIILISGGVKLAVMGSYALEVLGKLSDYGFSILICGTCLDFFKIRDKVQIGTVSNALEIMELMTGALKVIKL
jgi:selenium metabolism protein YedF